MKASIVVFLSALFGSALTQTIALPSDLTDGAYIISINGAGKQIVQDVTASRASTTGPTSAEAPPLNVTIPGRLRKRYPWPSNTFPVCSEGDWMLQSDFYDHSFNAFWDSCKANGNHKFPRGSVFANYQGQSVSYMCAFTTNPCNPAEWSDAVNWVSSNCVGRAGGWMENGFLDVPGWNKRYGYSKPGNRIC